MRAAKRSFEERVNERGVSIIIIAVAMFFVLGMAGLGIDLASLYVGRSQAQRAADAAALAGAQALVDQGCVTGSGSGLTSGCMAMARQRAKAVGDTNLIQGVDPNIDLQADISFPNQSNTDPQIQVVAGRGTFDGLDHGNAMPTFFMKIFGIYKATVSATAKAEAYNPSGTPTSIATSCLKPWLFPNCDASNESDPNPDCGIDPNTGNHYGYFVNTDGTVANNQNYPAGPIGEPYVLKPGTPGAAPAPGQFFAVYLPSASVIPTICPSCATTVTQGGTGSGALYRANIECCNNAQVTSGTTLTLESALQSTAGNMVGPTYSGVNCLISQDEGGTQKCGQDYAQGTTDNCTDPSSGLAQDMPLLPTIPPVIVAGSNTPGGGGSPMGLTQSASVIVVPIYNGVIASGQNTVTVAGFVQLFIRDVDKNQQGNVYAYVLGVSGAGTGGTNNSGNPVTSTYGTNVPIRLIN